MQLVETPDNPIPGEPVVMRATTQDGLALRVARWQPASQPARGTVCLLQGRAEFIEKYFETVTDLRGRGFAVVAFDWRGQGGSDRAVRNPAKGHVKSFALYRRDLEAVRDQVLEPLMPKPHFALAHSMGASIALLGACEGWLLFARLVATAPMIDLTIVKALRPARAAARLLRYAGFGRRFVPGGAPSSVLTLPFAGNRLTGDPRRYARNTALAAAVGPAAIGSPTIAWFDAANRLMHRLRDPRFPLGIRTPTLIVAAGADTVCSTLAIERFAARLKAGHAIVIPGARHEILMERDDIREAFWAAFDAFIPGTADQRTQAAVQALKDRAALPEGAADASALVQQRENRVMEPAVAHGDH